MKHPRTSSQSNTSRGWELGLWESPFLSSYGGMGMSFNTSMLNPLILLELPGSFSTTYGPITGIRYATILYYGDEVQKSKYLKLATGEWAHVIVWLSPDAGSDDDSGRTKSNFVSRWQEPICSWFQKMWIFQCGVLPDYSSFSLKLKTIRIWPHYRGENLRWNNDEWGRKKDGDQRIIYPSVFFNDCPQYQFLRIAFWRVQTDLRSL